MVLRRTASDGHMTAIPAAAAASPSANTTASARVSHWPRIQLRTPLTSAASAASANRRPPAIFTTCKRPERSRSARSQDSGMWTKRRRRRSRRRRPRPPCAASPSLPTSTADPRTRRSSRARGPCARPRPRASTARDRLQYARAPRVPPGQGRHPRQSRARTRLGQRWRTWRMCAARLDGHPPLLLAPPRRLRTSRSAPPTTAAQARCRSARGTPPSPLRARRTCAASHCGSSCASRTVAKPLHSGPSTTPPPSVRRPRRHPRRATSPNGGTSACSRRERPKRESGESE